jgi:hypothetical protein
MAAAATSDASDRSEMINGYIRNARWKASNVDHAAYEIAISKFLCPPTNPVISDKDYEDARNVIVRHNALLDAFEEDYRAHPDVEYKSLKHPNPLYDTYSFDIVRVWPEGHYNVYVTLPEGHPDIGTFYDYVHVNVYGGLTYSVSNVFGIDFRHRHDFHLETHAGRIKRFYDEMIVWKFENVKLEGYRMIEQFYNRAH